MMDTKQAMMDIDVSQPLFHQYVIQWKEFQMMEDHVLDAHPTQDHKITIQYVLLTDALPMNTLLLMVHA